MTIRTTIIAVTVALMAVLTAACGGGSTDSPSLSAGLDVTCVLDEGGGIQCWGDTDYRLSEVPQGEFTQLSVGAFHACAITDLGQLRCWGSGVSVADVPRGAFVQVAAGTDQTCAISEIKSVECWGNQGSESWRVPAWKFERVSVGERHACGIRDSGGISCWGVNRHGEGAPPDEGFIEVSAGVDHTCAITRDGVVWCWGSDEFGQTASPSGEFKAISSGAWHTCAIASGGEVRCWGRNVDGQAVDPGGKFQEIAAGYRHTCGKDSGDAVRCWGDNDYGQLDVPLLVSEDARSQQDVRRLSVREYARLCGGEWTDLTGQAFEADSPDEARVLLRRLSTSVQGVEPPAVLSDLHQLHVDLTDDLLELVEDKGAVEQFFRLTEIAFVYEERMDEVTGDLPASVYDTLYSYDCIE